MSHDTPTGAVRPNAPASSTSTSPVEWRWVREETLIKRLRRKLATLDLVLHRNRPGTAERGRYGEWSVSSPDCGVIWHNVTLLELARDMRVLATHERIEQPPRLRKHFVARHAVVEIDGTKVLREERLTRDFTSLDSAMRAASHMDGSAVVIVSYDADSRQEGSHGE